MEKNALSGGDASLREVLDRQMAAITAMLELQRELLRAVRELHDDAIGDTVARYRQKWAVVNGGME